MRSWVATNPPFRLGAMTIDPTANAGGSGPDDSASQTRSLAISEHTVALRKALLLGTLAWLLMSVISVVVWLLVSGTPGIWGVLVGAAIGGFFVLTTAIVTLATANSRAATMGATLLGTWLLKLIVVILVVALIKGMDFYSRPALVVTMALSLVVVLAVETWTVMRSNAPVIEPAIFRQK